MRWRTRWWRCVVAEAPTVDELRRLNVAIGAAEDAADAAFFEGLLHERFVMRRPTGRLDDRRGLVDGLATGATRVTSDVEVHVFGDHRAVATCTVTKWAGHGPAPADAARFHNLRTFLRDDDGTWRLLSWLNEPLA